MSFNVRVDVPSDGINQWKHRFPFVRDIILEQRPDILGLQELNDAMGRDLFPLLKDYDHVGDGRNADRTGERVSILYQKQQYKVSEMDTFWLSDTPRVAGSLDHEDGFPRICTTAVFQALKGGKTFRVYNVHFSYRSVRNRLQNVKTLLEFYRMHQQQKRYPSIVMGDFNCTIDDPLHLHMGQHGLREAVNELRGPRVNTYHEFKGKPGISAIDFFYTNADVKPLSVSVLMNQKGMLYPSDHYPIVGEFSFEK